MIKGIQVIGMLVGFFLVLQALISYRRGNFGIRRTLVLVFLWSVMIVLFLNPSFAIYALPILTTQDVIMSVTVMGLLFSFIFITHLFQQLSNLDRKFTELVQNLALTDYIKKIVKDNVNDDE